MVDVIYRNLTGESVHLADWPTPQHQDADLEARMQLVRNLAEAGRRVRVDNDHRQRLPCQTGWLVGAKGIDEFYPILAEEINVLDLQTENDLDRFQRIEVAPNRKTLGRKCRQDLPKVMAALAEADPDTLWDDIQNGRCIIAGFELEPIDVEVKRVEREGFAAMTAEDSDVTLVLDMTVTDELLSMGLAREIIRRVQQKRKDLDLDVEATISLSVWLDEGNPLLMGGDWDHIVSEVRAKDAVLDQGGQAPEGSDSFDVDGAGIHFTVE
jgi:isoleucyl-tRNA synthetase